MRFALVAFVLLTAPTVASADDRWEYPNVQDDTDDGQPTNNGLTHGTTQTHDLSGAPDIDYAFVVQRAYRSYEARIVDTQQCWTSTAVGGPCAHLDRVDGTNVVVQSGGTFDGFTVNGIALRWETDGAGTGFTWTRATGVNPSGTESQYEIQFYDTTYTVPRWNNSGGQVTVFLIQSAIARPVVGSIRFFSGAGMLLATVPLDVPATGLQVVSTASQPGLAGQSGSAVITHTGTYGTLAGKAVALEPGTGFSFDTPFSPVPLPR